MNKINITGTGGYEIPCAHTLTGGEHTVVIVSHGFGSTKESSTALMLEHGMAGHGAGVFAYDFPAHGDSPVDGSMLTVDRCLEDLAAVEQYVRAAAPVARICYFGSSFGAYISLLYVSERPHEGRRVFTRSAAVEMPLLIRNSRTPEQERELREHGFILFGAQYGYTRDLKLTQAFADSLDAHDLFARWKPGTAEVCMIHGDNDQVAPYEAAQRFAVLSGAQLITVPGGDHRLSIPGAPELVLKSAVDFLLGK